MAMVVRSMMVGTNLLNPTAPDNLRKASITSVEASQKSLTTLRRDIDLNVTELRLPDSALGTMAVKDVRSSHVTYMDPSRFARDDLVCLAGRLQFYIRPVCAGFCPAGPDGICRSTPHSPNGLVAQDDMQAWRIAV